MGHRDGRPVQISTKRKGIPPKLAVLLFVSLSAPGSTSAAMESSGGPALKLVVEKGPREGEIAEFQWGTRVKIGRVLRGNNFPIKDPSISQSHVSIVSDGAEASRRWTVSDLGSSNGTFLNGVPIEPSAAAELRGGDIIKIGERTTLRVEIVSSIAAPAEPPPQNVQRGTSRRGRPPRKHPDPNFEAGKKLEDSTVVEEAKGARRGGRRGRRAPARSAAAIGELNEEKTEENPNFDMEKMTLEEWFERMETYLPKVLNGIADEVIVHIKAKGDMFKNHIEHS